MGQFFERMLLRKGKPSDAAATKAKGKAKAEDKPAAESPQEASSSQTADASDDSVYDKEDLDTSHLVFLSFIAIEWMLRSHYS